MSFFTGTNTELLYSLPAAVTKNTYTTQAVFSALGASAPVAAVPANFFGSVPNGVGRSLYLKAMGTIATTSAATFAVSLGFDTTVGTLANGTTVMAATAPVAAITAPWNLEAWYTATAVGNTGGLTIQVNGRWVMEGVASGGVAPATALAVGFSGSFTATTGAAVAYFIELFGTWSASAAGNTTTLQQMFLFGLN